MCYSDPIIASILDGISATASSERCKTAEPVIMTKEKMPENAKSLMYVDSYGKMLRLKIADNEGFVARDRVVMPDIINVEVIKRKFKSQVIVTFADNSTETATLSYNDEFNMEQGISICVAKKLLSNNVGTEFGSSVYNKIIDRGVKVFAKNEKAKEKKRAEEETKKRKYEKTVAKKKAKREKRETEEREKQIEIQKEAILRALNQWNTRAAD